MRLLARCNFGFGRLQDELRLIAIVDLLRAHDLLEVRFFLAGQERRFVDFLAVQVSTMLIQGNFLQPIQLINIDVASDLLQCVRTQVILGLYQFDLKVVYLLVCRERLLVEPVDAPSLFHIDGLRFAPSSGTAFLETRRPR